ncbi:hypothetical protein COV19_05280 [Candidatus Woesearchaeota archaeon CG10_big_fil_rev_8_21_14_0_10_44_13]|nr:MAG: hypothetical protein COV19_05280 [Candidatus Woesearchaeota archaeon CG10_big_fil_rev_8_21_14_0_10_44_13]
MSIDDTLNGDSEEEYDNSFSEKGLLHVLLAGIPPRIANRYDIKFDGHQISLLHAKGVSYQQANSYGNRFSGNHVMAFINMGFSAADANRYKPGFTFLDIFFFAREGVPADQANKYDFDGLTALELIKKGISHEEANQFSRSFSSEDICEFISRGLKGEDVNYYHPSLKAAEVLKLIRKGVLPQDTIDYDSRFGSEDRLNLAFAKVPSEVANGFDIQFWVEHIIKLHQQGVKPEIANRFIKIEKGYTRNNPIDVDKESLSQHEYNESLRKHNVSAVMKLFDTLKEEEMPLEGDMFFKPVMDSYPGKPPRFSLKDIVDLCKSGVYADTAYSYNPRFSVEDILRLHLEGCSPAEAEFYDKRFDGVEIQFLYGLGFTPEKITLEDDCREKLHKNRNMQKLLEHVLISFKDELKRNRREIVDEKTQPLKYGTSITLLGTGSDGIVLLDQSDVLGALILDLLANQTEDGGSADIKERLNDLNSKFDINEHRFALKYATNTRYEAELFLRLKDPQHVVKAISYSEEGGYIKLEYAEGNSLENILKRYKKLPADNVVEYGSQILSGLMELLNAGIPYHRDIRPANILINEEKAKAKIIDLGNATTDRDAGQMGNRAYGGPNDLVSLGQVLYHMATLKHIFNRSRSMSITLAADDIKDYRNEVYQNPALLQMHLREVDETVKDAKVRGLIKACLTAGPDDHERIAGMFRDISQIPHRPI